MSADAESHSCLKYAWVRQKGYPAEDEHTGRGAVMPWQPITFMPVAAEITLGIHGSGSTLILLAVL